jgi:diguanylate cyclase (GGDEF)-like protein
MAVGDAGAALPIAERGVAAARATNDRASESRFLRCEGYARDSLGDGAAAFAAYAAAVVAAEAAGDADALADALTGRGEQLHFAGEYEGAIGDLKRAYDLYRAEGARGSQDYVLNAMANLYADPNVGEYDKAIAYYRELLARNLEAGNRGEVATAHFNLGATYDSRRDDARALAEYRRAYAIYQALGDAASMAEAHRVIGAVLARQGRATAALESIDHALAWYLHAGDGESVARTRLTRGIALRLAGAREAALRDLHASRAYFSARGNQRFLVRIDGERALAYAELGRWREAYTALRAEADAQQAVDKALLEARTSRLRVQFDTERTREANRALRAENASRGAALAAAVRERRLQRIAIALGALLLAVLAALALRQLLKLRRLRAIAATDELTGIANRRGILAFLDVQLRSRRRSGEPLSVVAFDVDHFKRINDVFGHDAGDRALSRVVALAGEGARNGDRMGRIGGEEFLLVLPGAREAVAVEIAERMRRLVAEASFGDIAPATRVTVSLGVAEWRCGEAADALRQRADAALYRAKEAGRDRTAASGDTGRQEAARATCRPT